MQVFLAACLALVAAQVATPSKPTPSKTTPTKNAPAKAASTKVAAVATAADAAKDWPTFRGANRTAVSPDVGLLKSWSSDGPPLVWEAKGAGRGYSSLAIAGDLIVTLGDAPSTADGDEDEYLVAFDRAGGTPKWKFKTGPAWKEGSPTWQSSRATPTIAGDMVYVVTAQGALYAVNAATGKQAWKKDLKADFGGKKGDGWGYSESPLVDGDTLVCTPGGDQATMVALNRKTGKPLWKSVREGDRGAGHASIVISQIGPTKVYVQTTASGALGVRAKDGKLLWSYEIEKTTAVIPTAVVRDDLVFFAAGYKRGGALLKQKSKPRGEVEIEEIYGINKDLANKHGGIVLVGDYLYGDSDDQGIPFCAELMTGKIVWKERGAGRGSVAIAAADGCLYLHYQDCTMELAKADPAGYQSLGSFKTPGSGERPGWMHPVVADGKLYVREQDSIYCYDVKAK